MTTPLAKQRSEPDPTPVKGWFARTDERLFSGYVLDRSDPSRRFVVELVIDGIAVSSMRADIPVDDPVAREVGDGCFGFVFAPATTLLADAGMVEARIANLDIRIGDPIAVRASHRSSANVTGAGTVRWLGGLRFSGWIAPNAEDAFEVFVEVDGEPITTVTATGWAQSSAAPNDRRPVRAFQFHVPERFADGAVHRLVVTGPDGVDFPECPLAFVAFPDGLARTMDGLTALDSERLRGEMFDRLVPASLPMSAYPEWLERFPLEPPAPVAIQLAVVMVGPGSVEDTLAGLGDQTHPNWIAAALPAEDEAVAFEAAALRDFLSADAREASHVVFVLAGTELAPTALARIAAVFCGAPATPAVYCDFDLASRDGSPWPLALSAFDYERMLEQGGGAYLFAVDHGRAARAAAAGADTLFRLFNSVLDDPATPADEIVHLPGTAGTLPMLPPVSPRALVAATDAHLRARGIRAEVTASAGRLFPSVHVVRKVEASDVTVVIPTRDRHDLLRRCIESIEDAVAGANGRILVVDNDSSDPEAVRYLSNLSSRRVSVLHAPGPFNYARLNNLAVAASTSTQICLLNNDIEARDQDWLPEMLSRLADPGVGAVGALLVWPSGVVQHGGVVLGPGFRAAHAFTDRTEEDSGYADLLQVAHECSAVTAACLLTRRADWIAVGGLDEVFFPVNFNDVDYCLKLRARGRRVVLTPHARLLHRESASRGRDDRPDRAARYERELRMLRSRWGEVLAADPFYNPVLSLDPVPYSALAWPPRERHGRSATTPGPADVPDGF
ncbi:glycosyltransferase family 2 protein [Rhodoplanes roseus]|uniref:Glycosyltransferase 2-like domain-containing protein n=1 Tax=Rhodoplanes roseus TaxID=29409 RepID=A0A327L4V0_9BRAD|nr:glycosyltransferase family 2 protein [Rhodoplanes roseus]RAI45005.1 hypothetical protein CH341_06220 [Rhodoplanes roseus]